MTIKVMHVVFKLGIGGLEKVLVNCVNRLPQDQYFHHIVSLCPHSEELIEMLPENVSVVSFDKKEGNDWRIFWRLHKQIRHFKPDCLHTYNLATFELQLVGWFNNVKLRIHAEHGRDIFDPQGRNKKYLALRKVMSRFVHKIISVSNDLFDWLSQQVKLSPKKLLLIRNGIDTEFFKPRESKNTSNTFIFGHIGRLAKIKNQGLLIQSFAEACSNSVEFANKAKLRITGEGECRHELETLIEKLELDDSVVLTGATTDVISEYQSLDAFVMSSIAEGIPMTLLEAMSCGIAPIVTRVGGIPEVITNDTGFMYQSNDKEMLCALMSKVFETNGLAHQYGMRARAHIERNFSEESMVSAYDTLYSTIRR